MPRNELSEWVNFADEDAWRLKDALPVFLPKLEGVSELFYEAIENNSEAKRSIKDDDQRDRLKKTLVTWLQEFLSGPHDDAYFLKRTRIGKVHVRVGLPQRYVMAAMNVLRTELGRIASEEFPDKALPFIVSMSKLMDIELAIMLQSYIDEYTEDELSAFRNAVFSHLPISAFVLDRDVKVVDATPRHRPILAKPNVIGESIYDVLTPNFCSAANLENQINRCRSTRNAVVLPRVDVNDDSTQLPATYSYRVTILPIDQRMATTILHIEDLTDAIRTEARRSQERSLIGLGTMAATVAHEIRNPLAGISAAIQVVRNTFDDDDGRRKPLGMVNDQVTRLGDLVGDLLEFARPIQSRNTHLDLRETIDHVVSQYPSTEGKFASVDGTGTAIADAAHLGQSLGNLLTNAWQAGASSIKIHVESGAVSISDDGPGISDEIRGRVFEPFFTTRTRGTGLGLPQVKKAIEQMGGSIELLPATDVGTAFRIRLLDRV